MASISPFNILLNNLSSDLSKLNLHNLVNVCGELISEIEWSGMIGWFYTSKYSHGAPEYPTSADTGRKSGLYVRPRAPASSDLEDACFREHRQPIRARLEPLRFYGITVFVSKKTYVLSNSFWCSAVFFIAILISVSNISPRIIMKR